MKRVFFSDGFRNGLKSSLNVLFQFKQFTRKKNLRKKEHILYEGGRKEKKEEIPLSDAYHTSYNSIIIRVEKILFPPLSNSNSQNRRSFVLEKKWIL